MADSKLDIRVYPIDEPKGNTVAFASVAIDDLVAIRGVRVVESDKGLFVSMPQSQEKKTEEFHDVAFPVNKDLRKEINKAVLEEYHQQAALAPDQRGYTKPEAGADDINAADVKLDIRVFPLSGEQQNGNTKAFANVTVDDTVTMRGVRVIEGEKGLFVSMPQSRSEKDGKTEYHDVAFPLNGDLRKEISRAVIEKFEAGDKSKNKSLANGLKDGADKAAQNSAVTKDSAAKKPPGIGE